MSALSDYQFEIGGLAFGYGLDVATDGEGFDPGDDDIEDQDFFSTLTEGVAFGVDSLRPRTWSWECHTDRSTTPEAAAAADRALELAWRNAVDHRSPGHVAELRYCIHGRTRVVYGRPGRYRADRTNKMLYGVIAISMEFRRADRLFYGDEVMGATVSMQPQENYGLVSPLVSPITTLEGTPSFGVIPATVGDVAAPFRATIHGPSSGSLVNPKISTPNWQIQLNTSIAAGSSVVVSTYPWDLSAIRSDGANVSGTLTASSRLSRARLDPAGETVRMDGVDSSGTSYCDLSWRPAYSTI